MLSSLIMLLAFLGKRTKILGSLIGGIGFGLFIDELGKFITFDNNYFYQPTAALIYLIFLGLFFLFRFIESYQSLRQEEYLMNALRLLEEVILNDMDKDEKEKYLQYLTSAGNHHYIAKELYGLIDKLSIHTPKPIKLKRYLLNFMERVNTLFKTVTIHRLIYILFIVHFLITVLTAITLVFNSPLNQHSIFNLVLQKYIFISWGEFISLVASAALSVSGLVFLPISRRKAYLLFKYSVLVSILLTSFFSFYRLQFAALFGLVLNISLLIGVNYMFSTQVVNKTETSKT